MKILVFFFLTTISAANAADKAIPAICADQCAKCDQTSMNICSSAYLAEADNQLNATYKKLVSEGDSSKLRNSQRAWLKYRDAQCEYEAASIAEGGSMYPAAYSSCITELTEKRVKELSAH